MICVCIQPPNITFPKPCDAGLIQPELLPDGQVCVDMGEPILEAEHVPTTLQPTQVCDIVTPATARATQD